MLEKPGIRRKMSETPGRERKDSGKTASQKPALPQYLYCGSHTTRDSKGEKKRTHKAKNRDIRPRGGEPAQAIRGGLKNQHVSHSVKEKSTKECKGRKLHRWLTREEGGLTLHNGFYSDSWAETFLRGAPETTSERQ